MNKSQFDDWQSYLKIFLSQGGIIEAYPPSDSVTSMSVSISIDPDGQYSIMSSGDHLHAESQFSCWGLSFPQSSVEPNEINLYCSQIVEQCKQRNISGYIDIDFVTFIDAKTDKQQLWVIDLSIGYSEHMSLFRVMKFISGGKFDGQTHAFTVKVKQAKQRTRNWQTTAAEHIVRNQLMSRQIFFSFPIDRRKKSLCCLEFPFTSFQSLRLTLQCLLSNVSCTWYWLRYAR